MRGRAHTCSLRQPKSSLIMSYEWTAALAAAASRLAAAQSPVVLPAQVLGPIGRAKPCDMILLLVLRGGLEAHILAGV